MPRRVFSIFSLARLPPQTLVFLSSTLSFSLSPAQAPHSRPPALRRRVKLRAIPRPIRSGARGVMMASSADHSTMELSASKNVVDFTAVDFNSNDASCVPVQTAKVAPEAHFLAETCRCVIKQVSRRLKRLDWRRGAKEFEARTEQGLRLRLHRRRRRRASKPLFFEPFFHALRHTLSFLYAAQGLPICPALLMDARERSHTAAACIKGGERTRTRASRRFSLAIVFSFQAVSIDSVLDSRELARRRKARVPAISHLISPRPPPTPFSSLLLYTTTHHNSFAPRPLTALPPLPPRPATATTDPGSGAFAVAAAGAGAGGHSSQSSPNSAPAATKRGSKGGVAAPSAARSAAPAATAAVAAGNKKRKRMRSASGSGSTSGSSSSSRCGRCDFSRFLFPFQRERMRADGKENNSFALFNLPFPPTPLSLDSQKTGPSHGSAEAACGPRSSRA